MSSTTPADLSLKTVIQDIVKSTAAVGYGSIKLTSDPTGVLIEAFNDSKTVIMKGKTNAPVPELGTHSFGLVNLDMLRGYVQAFGSDDAAWALKTIQKNGNDVPESILFDSSKGTSAVYRLASLCPPQPKASLPKYDVTVNTPSKTKISEFGTLAGILSSVETKFMPRTKNGNLVFLLGEEQSSTDSAEVCIQEGIQGTLKGQFHWPVQETLTILKVDYGNTQICIADAGLMTIKLNSGVASYEFHLPGHQ